MRVVEVFGPTIQGEGPYAGRVTHFVRFGGCDYRCSWCDSMHAVEPALVRQADDLTPADVMRRLRELEPAPMLVISGGNPALQHLSDLIEHFRAAYELVAVETQGSLWRPWLARVDSLVISPKPPSSGEATAAHWRQLEAFMAASDAHTGRAIKVVVFDGADLAWARMVYDFFGYVPFYLSVGTDPDDTAASLGERYAWLCEQVIADPRLHAAVVLPQLHVVAWGHRVGV
jgi:7-carboxy-7-deazaguanine synthase